ncbi:DUF4238 domain-containing protein [Providencia sp. R1]|uniref:DUF4238 domain-containing protein n=1 Tax=unclassified Providencia TaxID=2633465 RepID=UPI003D329CB1
MSGRMQHYIPQSFLRGFSLDQKSQQTYVYNKNKSYISNINRIAVQRDFYSIPSLNGEETLDDKITNYESNRLGVLLGNLRLSEVGSSIDPYIAAEVIAHLSPRSKSIRSMFGNATNQLIVGISDIFSNKEAVLSVMELNDPLPNKTWRDRFSSLLNDDLELKKLIDFVMSKTNIPKTTLEKIGYMLIKENILGDTLPVNELAKYVLSILINNIDKTIESAHKKFLNSEIIVEPRKQSLVEFTWFISSAQGEGAIMPDCIAIALDEEGVYLPYIMASGTSIIVMPLTSEKILIGLKSIDSIPDLSNFNNEASACCSEFFISSSSNHAYLSENIGNRWKTKSDFIVHDSLNELLNKNQTKNEVISDLNSIPSVSFQLNFTNWSTDFDIQSINKVIKTIIHSMCHSLNLNVLDAITFTSNFEKSLSEIDRGFKLNDIYEGTPDYIAQGVAALLVIKDGKPKVHLVLHQEYALSLIEDNSDNTEIALHFLVAGLAIVHITDKIEKILPNLLMEPFKTFNHSAVLHCALRKAVRAYQYSYISANFGSAEIIEEEYYNYFITTFDVSQSNILKAKEEYKVDRDSNKFLCSLINDVGNILTCTARVVGHLQGAKGIFIPPEKSLIETVILSHQLTGWVNAFASDLHTFWNIELWSKDDFYALNIHVERLLWPHHIFLFPTDDNIDTTILPL